MPVVEKVRGGRVNVRGIGEFSPGDRAEVSAADAEYLCDDRGDFERVDDAAVSGDGFDAEAWLDQDYRDRADRVEAGDVDEHLGKIRNVETSDTVIDAIDERQEG